MIRSVVAIAVAATATFILGGCTGSDQSTPAASNAPTGPADGATPAASCGATSTTDSSGLLTLQDVWPPPGGGGYTSKVVTLDPGDCPKQPDKKPSVCEVGFPWYSAAEVNAALAHDGVREFRSATIVHGDGEGEVREVVLVFDGEAATLSQDIMRDTVNCTDSKASDARGRLKVAKGDAVMIVNNVGRYLVAVEFTGTPFTDPEIAEIVDRAETATN